MGNLCKPLPQLSTTEWAPKRKFLIESKLSVAVVNPVTSRVTFVSWTRFRCRLTHLGRCLVATDDFFGVSRAKMELKMLIFRALLYWFWRWFITLLSPKNEYFCCDIIKRLGTSSINYRVSFACWLHLWYPLSLLRHYLVATDTVFTQYCSIKNIHFSDWGGL